MVRRISCELCKTWPALCSMDLREVFHFLTNLSRCSAVLLLEVVPPWCAGGDVIKSYTPAHSLTVDEPTELTSRQRRTCFVAPGRMVAPPTTLGPGEGRMHHVKSTSDKSLSDFEATLAMLPPRLAARLSLDPSRDSSPQVNLLPDHTSLLNCISCGDAVQHIVAPLVWRREAASPAHPQSTGQKSAIAASGAGASPAAALHGLSATEAKTGAASPHHLCIAGPP